MNAWRGLGTRDRRALVLGAGLLVPALLGNFVVRPYSRARTALRDRIAEQRGLLGRELALLRADGHHADDLPVIIATLDKQRVRLLPAHDPLGATAALVGLVGEKARSQGILLESIESRAPERLSAGLIGVRIEVSARADFEGVVRWLHALETDSRLLRVDWLVVSRGGSGDAPDSADVEQLGLAAVVRAYVRETQ